MWTYNDIISMTSNTEKRKNSESEKSNTNNKRPKFESEDNKENEKLTNLDNREKKIVYQQNTTDDKPYPTQTRNEKSENVIISKIDLNIEENNSAQDDPKMIELLVNCYKKHTSVLQKTLKDDKFFFSDKIFFVVRDKVTTNNIKEKSEGRSRSFTI